MKKQRKLLEDSENEIDHTTPEDLESSGEFYEFNTNLDYQTIQAKVSHENEDRIHLSRLNDMIDVIFQESRWTILNPNKKISKDLIPLIFQDILKELESTEFTMVEKFVAICDYASISYQKAYESIHMKYKENIIQEMDLKFKILEKKGIKKIF
jgi:hypothetical protein